MSPTSTASAPATGATPAATPAPAAAAPSTGGGAPAAAAPAGGNAAAAAGAAQAGTGAAATAPQPAPAAPLFAQLLQLATQDALPLSAGGAPGSAPDGGSGPQASNGGKSAKSGDGGKPADGGTAMPAMTPPLMAIIMSLPIATVNQPAPVSATAGDSAGSAVGAVAGAVTTTPAATPTPISLSAALNAAAVQALPVPAAASAGAATAAASDDADQDSNSEGGSRGQPSRITLATLASQAGGEAVVSGPAMPALAAPASAAPAGPAPRADTATAARAPGAATADRFATTLSSDTASAPSASGGPAGGGPASAPAPAFGDSQPDSGAAGGARGAPTVLTNGGGVNSALLQQAASAGSVKLSGSPEQWQQPLRDALGERMQLQLQNNDNQAVIRLAPPDMGHIDITIRHSGDTLQVNLSASNSDVLRQLSNISDSVRQDLSQRQFNSVAVTVSASPRGAQQFADGDARRQQGQQQEQDPGRALSEDGQPASTFAMMTERE